MTSISDALLKSLDLGGAMEYDDDNLPEPEPPAKLEIVPVESSFVGAAESDITRDYIHARNTVYTLLTLTGDALAGALKMAQEDQHPRSYEVFNGLATTVKELTKDLIGLQKMIKEVTKDKPEFQPPPAPTSTTNIQLFAGSTSEIISRFSQRLEEEGKTVDG